jgi:hypothetical protein
MDLYSGLWTLIPSAYWICWNGDARTSCAHIIPIAFPALLRPCQMLRLSDRLISKASDAGGQLRFVKGLVDSSDGIATVVTGNSTRPAEHQYAILVDLLGLHQTVKLLENEYIKIAGGDGKMSTDPECDGYLCQDVSILRLGFPQGFPISLNKRPNCATSSVLPNVLLSSLAPFQSILKKVPSSIRRILYPPVCTWRDRHRVSEPKHSNGRHPKGPKVHVASSITFYRWLQLKIPSVTTWEDTLSSRHSWNMELVHLAQGHTTSLTLSQPRLNRQTTSPTMGNNSSRLL